MLAPIGLKVPDNVPSGRQAVDHIANTLGDAYDNLLPNLSAKPDGTFMQDMHQDIFGRAFCIQNAKRLGGLELS